MRRTWSVVVPVKDSTVGKSRLSAYADARPALARALALDTLAAVAACRAVGTVVVVTSDDTVAAHASRVTRHVVVPDPGGGLDAAIVAGLATLQSSSGPVAVLTADLPALTAAELEDALVLAEAHPLAVVPDADGTGTTLLAATDVELLEPRFGVDSLAAHLAQDAASLPAGPGLRRDTDLPEHLDVLGPSLGPRTTDVLARLRVR
ncbi:2-phospho-L-lactate guanylyltransferase [Mumia zhuanghuii]|uniref:2-phospho-L-lactate guanylyltransferase n=1 Tax=Mumia zhuanghuii TaxID=2585211 RepID=UPI001E385029|nr:2-phospho-L-lactate guanylyltransferase [Mumia zhuanghuii]